MTNMYYSTSTTYSITTNNTGAMGNYYGTINTAVGSNGSYWITGNNFATSKPADLEVKGDAEFGGDIRWKGRSLGTLLEKIEDRLAILPDPNPKKLEKFAALKKAYEQYKLMEKLIGEE